MAVTCKTHFCEYITSFLTLYLPCQMGRSDNTVGFYRDSLTMFRRFLNDRDMSLHTLVFDEVTPELVRNFLSWLDEKGNSPQTRNQRLSGLKGYLLYSADRDVNLSSIAARIIRIAPFPVAKQEKVLLSDEAFAAILRQLPSTMKGARNKAMLLLLSETAIRVSELTGLLVSDLHIDRELPYIRVRGKGKKERHVPITDTLCSVLRKYLKNCHDGRTDVLFYTNHCGEHTKLSARSVQSILSGYAEKARKTCDLIPEHVYPHMLRRSRATNLYRNGMSLELVSSMLGHEQLETTRIYAKPSMEQMRANMDNLLPPSAMRKRLVWKDKEEDFARKLGLR